MNAFAFMFKPCLHVVFIVWYAHISYIHYIYEDGERTSTITNEHDA